tara:strand:- start:714 stop:1133 length:420 start_codon:yes stop_codon:yes gene_type:complete
MQNNNITPATVRTVTIHKFTSSEANVSDRTIRYDLYLNGLFYCQYGDINIALDAKELLENISDAKWNAVLKNLSTIWTANKYNAGLNALQLLNKKASSSLASVKSYMALNDNQKASEVLKLKDALKENGHYDQVPSTYA